MSHLSAAPDGPPEVVPWWSKNKQTHIWAPFATTIAYAVRVERHLDTEVAPRNKYDIHFHLTKTRSICIIRLFLNICFCCSLPMHINIYIGRRTFQRTIVFGQPMILSGARFRPQLIIPTIQSIANHWTARHLAPQLQRQVASIYTGAATLRQHSMATAWETMGTHGSQWQPHGDSMEVPGDTWGSLCGHLLEPYWKPMGTPM